MKKNYKKFIYIFFIGSMLFFNHTIKGQTLPIYVPSNGLIGWWSFNGNANDISGNGLNGTIIGAVLCSDRNNIFNSAYDFDFINASFGQQNDEIYIPYTSLLNVNQITVSVWIYPRTYYWGSNPTASTIIRRYENGYSNPNGQAWGIDFTQNNFYAFINQASQNTTQNGVTVSSNNALILNTWNNIVFTYDNSNLNLFLNGNLVNSVLTNLPMNVNSNSGISVGESRQANGYWNYTNGKIDDIGIWNRALTQAEINLLYNSCNGVSIITEPLNQILAIGNDAYFFIQSIDTNAIFQWQSNIGLGFQNITNAGQYNGVNNDTLIISNINTQNNGQLFQCIVTSGNCIDTSNIVSITGCPIIGIQPTDQNVSIGNNAKFNTSYNFSTSNYQWQTDLGFGFQNISNSTLYNGANSDTLIILNVSSSNNNQLFKCLVSSGNCYDTTTVAKLVVNNLAIIKDFINFNNLCIYPNPVSNELIIEMEGNKDKLDFEILNSIGKVIYKGVLIDKTIIQTSDFAGGVYLIKLNNGKKYQFKKIVKE